MPPLSLTHDGVGRLIVTIPGLGSRTVIFNSRIAGVLGRGDDLTLAFTPDATRICVEGDKLTRDHLGHEWGHGEKAKELGWRYLPWVFWHYAKSRSTTNNLPERLADAWYDAHREAFAGLPWIITAEAEL